MQLNTTWFISKRLLGKNGGKRDKTATIVSVTGIALSTIIVLLTFSIVTGFQRQIKEKILAFSSPISVYTYSEYYNEESEKELETILNAAKEINPESRISRTVFIPALLKSENNFGNYVLQNLNDSIKKEYFEEYLIEGSFNPDSVPNGVTISRVIAEDLDVKLLDRIDVVVPAGETVKLRKLTVTGIYDTHFSDYDENIGFVTENFIKSIIKTDTKAANRINIDFPNPNTDELNSFARKLQTKLDEISLAENPNNAFTVYSITKEAGAYFGWLALMDTNVSIVIILMIFISVFTLISSVMIIILDKVPLIGLLKTLGYNRSRIKRIFFLIGARIIFWSLVIADFCGLFIIYAQNNWHFLPLNPEEYYLTEVPMDLTPLIFILVNVGAIVAGLLSLLLPLLIIDRISPSKAIKFK